MPENASKKALVPHNPTGQKKIKAKRYSKISHFSRHAPLSFRQCNNKKKSNEHLERFLSTKKMKAKTSFCDETKICCD